MGSIPEATQPGLCDPESVPELPAVPFAVASLLPGMCTGSPRGQAPQGYGCVLRLLGGTCWWASALLPANSLGHSEENGISHGGAFFSRHPQPSIKNGNGQQLMYLFTLPDGGRRAARRRQLGRVREAICLIVSSTPSREVVAPRTHLDSRAAYQDAECPLASGQGLFYHREQMPQRPPRFASVSHRSGFWGLTALDRLHRPLGWLTPSRAAR